MHSLFPSPRTRRSSRPDTDRSRRVLRIPDPRSHIPYPISNPTLLYHIVPYLDCLDATTAELWHSPSLLTPSCIVSNAAGSFTLICFLFPIGVSGHSSSSFGFWLPPSSIPTLPTHIAYCRCRSCGRSFALIETPGFSRLSSPQPSSLFP